MTIIMVASVFGTRTRRLTEVRGIVVVIVRRRSTGHQHEHVHDHYKQPRQGETRA